jgi:hypothetical protein
MKLNISKTWSAGPMKFTLSKSGGTVSVGVPGARVSLNTKGVGKVRVGAAGFNYQKSKKLIK